MEASVSRVVVVPQRYLHGNQQGGQWCYNNGMVARLPVSLTCKQTHSLAKLAGTHRCCVYSYESGQPRCISLQEPARGLTL